MLINLGKLYAWGIAVAIMLMAANDDGITRDTAVIGYYFGMSIIAWLCGRGNK